jgi:uncharacterized protein with HEPN domain
MTQHDTTARLGHMLTAAAEAVEMIESAGADRASLDSNRMLALALIQLCTIVGEAASRIPPSDRAGYSAIPWPSIIGLRNRLVHGYADVDLDILWQIITKDLPPLIAELERILA